MPAGMVAAVIETGWPATTVLALVIRPVEAEIVNDDCLTVVVMPTAPP